MGVVVPAKSACGVRDREVLLREVRERLDGIPLVGVVVGSPHSRLHLLPGFRLRERLRRISNIQLPGKMQKLVIWTVLLEHW